VSRRVPTKGQSYADVNPGRFIAVQEDVLGYKRLIEDRWSELEVIFDQIDNVWSVIEHCRDGRERLVFNTKVLGEATLKRIAKAEDNVNFDVEIDEHNERLKEEQASRFKDQMGDFAQRFKFALEQDGYYDHEDVYGSRKSGVRNGRDVLRNRA